MRPATRPRRRLGRLALAGLLVYAGVCIAMFALQRSLLYHPDPTLAVPDGRRLPGVQAVTLATGDGERLVAWWRPSASTGGPVVIYLHGNAAHLGARTERLAWLVDRGTGLLAVNWRGYGGSTGQPSEAGLIADARAAWDALTTAAPASLPGRGAPVAPSRIVLFGESLGTTVAVRLAAQVDPGALVLDSGFLSVLDVAQRHYPWLPVSALLRDPLRADLAAPSVQAPVLQVHCADDPVTPTPSARALHTLFPRAEPMVIVDGRCHTPPLTRWEAPLRDFLERLGSQAAARP